MRIAFLTNGLAQGRDGVGDYARGVAAACMRLGHEALLVALSDPSVANAREELQDARAVQIPTLRLPATDSWRQRALLAGQWLDARKPDWISVQLVPYGLQRKGILAGIERHLVSLARGRRVQIMFHEIWIGAETGAAVRQRLVGAVQRAFILRLTRSLMPQVVHTSNPAYAALLAESRIGARVLPLCGNVSIAPSNPGWLQSELLRRGLAGVFPAARSEEWRFGLFGSLHPRWSPEPLFERIRIAAGKAGRNVLVVSMGRLGDAAERWQELERTYAPQLSLRALGECSEEEVSWFLQDIHFGIATTPWRLIGKSGSVAAMLDHGVPVVVPRDDVAFGMQSGTANEPLLYRLDDGLEAWLRRPPARRAPRDGFAAVAEQLLQALAAPR